MASPTAFNVEGAFGHRMLKTMGWKGEGSGLGAREDGITEAIKATKRPELFGIGATTRTENWVENTANFNNILERLAAKKKALSGDTTPASASPTSSSPTTGKALVSAKRFVFQKRLTAKLEVTRDENKHHQDKILGHAMLEKKAKETQHFEKTKLAETPDENPHALNHKISTVSMEEYFRSRGAKAASVLPEHMRPKEQDSDEDGEQCGMMIGFQQTESDDGASPCTSQAAAETDADERAQRKAEKRMRKAKEAAAAAADDSNADKDDSERRSDEISKKKGKKRREQPEESDEQQEQSKSTKKKRQAQCCEDPPAGEAAKEKKKRKADKLD